MSNPYGRRGKAGFVASNVAFLIGGGILCYFGYIGWGIAVIIFGIIMLIWSYHIAYRRKK